MKIYFASQGAKHAYNYMKKKGGNKLFSYMDLIDNTRGFGAWERFLEWIGVR